VRELIWRRYRVRLAVRRRGTYLARWGFTAQKPLRRAYEQDPAAVRRWMRRDYPALVARARRARGVIFWGDEPGLRSDDVRGRSYAPRGRTPVVRVCHKRAGLSLLSAVANKGELRWMVVEGAVKAPDLVRLLRRLVRDVGRPQGLPDPGPTEGPPGPYDPGLAGRASGRDRSLLPAPSYSPELNPDEGVNADLKQAVPRKAPARSKQQPKRAVVSHMRGLSKRPQRIRAIFQHQRFRHAA
jgi:hypothetical protein